MRKGGSVYVYYYLKLCIHPYILQYVLFFYYHEYLLSLLHSPQFQGTMREKRKKEERREKKSQIRKE